LRRDACRPRSFRRLDGSTNRIQRMINIEEFNKPNSEVGGGDGVG
jgi:hypothetical protein